jgi:hypothetical protein
MSEARIVGKKSAAAMGREGAMRPAIAVAQDYEVFEARRMLGR